MFDLEALIHGSEGGADPRITTLHLAGEFDISSKDALSEMLREHANSDVAILDLQNVTFLDSSALHCFLLLRKEMQQLGKAGIIRIANANAMISRILRISGLDAVFELHDSVESAQRVTEASS